MAEEFGCLATASVATSGQFTVALVGGSTPKAAYALLAREPYRSSLPWAHIHVFWGDERHVPPNHPDSNYRMAHEALLSKVAIPPNNIHRIRAEHPAPEAACSYAVRIRTVFGLRHEECPRFDLVLLGMGPDGHTASLFPGTAVIHERAQLVGAPWVEAFNSYRITMTPPVLRNAKRVIFTVGGAEKVETLYQVLRGDYQPDRYPS
jgi:6-phosphogluconolactonase